MQYKRRYSRFRDVAYAGRYAFCRSKPSADGDADAEFIAEREPKRECKSECESEPQREPEPDSYALAHQTLQLRYVGLRLRVQFIPR